MRVVFVTAFLTSSVLSGNIIQNNNEDPKGIWATQTELSTVQIRCFICRRVACVFSDSLATFILYSFNRSMVAETTECPLMSFLSLFLLAVELPRIHGYPVGDYISQPPLQAGAAMGLTYGQWNVSGSDLFHLWATFLKGSCLLSTTLSPCADWTMDMGMEMGASLMMPARTAP